MLLAWTSPRREFASLSPNLRQKAGKSMGRIAETN
jgi:hypothetical protein